MMKLFTTNQIADIDRYTIAHEPVTDIDLMERAALKMTNHLGAYIRYRHPLLFFAGPGNNGGDALAMARLYAGEGYPVTAYLLDTGRSLSPSCETNRQRLLDQGKARFRTIAAEKDFPEIPRQSAVIDGLFGAGLTRPLEGLPAALVRHLNASGARIFAIDMPSGLLGEDNSQTHPDHIIRARATFTLQFPKISLLFPENEAFAGRVEIVDIGLHPHALTHTESPFRMTTPEELRGLFPLRKRFAHKGAFGHALLIAGSYGKTGAALLAAQGCLRSGAGLVTIHTPRCGLSILQAAAPEAMCSVDPHEEHFTQLPPTGKYAAIGAGPGLGTNPVSGTALRNLLQTARTPLLLDADALNLIAAMPEGLSLIPSGTILTPHPGEFSRLTAGITPPAGHTPPTGSPTTGPLPSGQAPFAGLPDVAATIDAQNHGKQPTAGEDPITLPPGGAAPGGHLPEAFSGGHLPEAFSGGHLQEAFSGSHHPEAFSGSWQRLQLQRELSRRHQIIIVLKGAFTTITLPSGEVCFNPTGNPGMATGGSGDVLTGIITGLLAQGLPPASAAIAGVYLHGLAADLSAERFTEPALIAGDIHRNLGRAFRKFYGRTQQEID